MDCALLWIIVATREYSGYCLQQKYSLCYNSTLVDGDIIHWHLAFHCWQLPSFWIVFYYFSYYKISLNTLPFHWCLYPDLYCILHICGLCGTAQRWWGMTSVINALTINCHIMAEPAFQTLPRLHSAPFPSCLVRVMPLQPCARLSCWTHMVRVCFDRS